MTSASPVVTTSPSLSSRRTLILAACLMATFMAAIESTIVATAMPTIVASFGGFDLFSWVFAIYLLTQAVSIPIYGRLAEIYGRKARSTGGGAGSSHGLGTLLFCSVHEAAGGPSAL